MSITTRQAEKVLEAIHAAFPAHVNELDVDDNLVPIINPDYLPSIKRDWDGFDTIIVWESGSPYDWTMLFPYGGVDPEFGGRVKDVSAKMPARVRAEAVSNCVIALYKD